MGESKGKAWIGKIYNRLEKILVEVDTFAAQSALCLKSSHPEDSHSNMHTHRDRVASPSSERPFVPPLHQNFEILGNVRVEERVEEDHLNESLLSGEMLSDRAPLVEDYLKSATTCGDQETRITNTLTPQGSGFPGQESVQGVRVELCKHVVSSKSQSTQTSVESIGECHVLPALGINTNVPIHVRSSNEDKTDDGTNGKSGVASLDTKALYSKAFREDLSYVDDNALYAVRVRTKKLRSFKRKVLDALNSKRRREEEYEHLAIWFGDADMGSDLATDEAIDSKSSRVLESEDSQWELL